MRRREILPLTLGGASWLVATAQVGAIETEKLASALPVPDMQAVPLPDFGVSFQHLGQELTQLHASPQQFRPYLFPLRGPAGRSLTRLGHPRDPVTHSHHNSVWISHEKVSGTNFWGDSMAENAGRIVPVKIERLWDSADRCGCLLVNEWLRHGPTSASVLKERRTMEAWKPDADGNWLLVVDLELAAPESAPVVLGETAFGLVGVRLAKTIGVHDGGGRILNSAGQRNEAECFRKPAKWVDYSGPLTATDSGGVALFDHPQNPNHPNVFHVRNDGWMGACVSFTAPLTIEKERPLKLRYGFWAHQGVPTAAAVEAAWAAFSQLGPSGAVDQARK